MTLVERYSKALINNDTEKCAEIESEYGLYGYPPELVHAGLKGVDMGLDPIVAVEDYIAAV